MSSKYIQRYRNRIDILAQLLDAASSPITKTKMMYKAMLSYEQLKEYLVTLAQNDLIAYDNASRRFTTTDKGYQFLKRYGELNALIEPLATIADRRKSDNVSAGQFGKQVFD
jgi:predicted transcriptional regulator